MIDRRASAVLTSFNKREDVRKNLRSLLAQVEPFQEIIVVDNASKDGTIEMVRTEFPSVRLIVMPDPSYGACETFNIGFSSAQAPFIAILDDDIVLPPDWLKRLFDRFEQEPETTAMISTKVIEPEMPQSYIDAPAVNEIRYMSTFRGCGTLSKAEVIRRAGWYDERFFIYGNERDLAARVLGLGYRILQFPPVVTQHGTPFGMKKGARSLYYHVRNFWLVMFKHAPLSQILGFPFAFVWRRVRRRDDAEDAADAVGGIGLIANIRQTKRGWWIVIKATLAALANLPYCWKRRKVCRAPDFEMPDV